MFRAGRSRDVAIATDWRLQTDGELDASEPAETHVLHFLPLGRAALGRRWLRAERVALFDHGEKPSGAAAGERREQFLQWLGEHRPKRLYIIPTPDSTLGGDQAALKGTHCWQALHAPDTLDAMRGTRWRRGETEIVPLFPNARRVKELQRWCSAQWLQAHAMPTLLLDDAVAPIHPGPEMVVAMEGMRGRPLAVDLEFNPATDVVTAVGLSDGRAAVSIPWDTYTPRNNEGVERGIEHFGSVGRRIAALLGDLLRADTAKVAHNFVADIPRLERRGFAVSGPMHDTFAAHAIAFPELRHGLQHAAASLLPVPPWKSLYRPSRLARGITRDDAEFWTADPVELRRYNTKDAYFTWMLAQAVLPYVHLSWS